MKWKDKYRMFMVIIDAMIIITKKICAVNTLRERKARRFVYLKETKMDLNQTIVTLLYNYVRMLLLLAIDGVRKMDVMMSLFTFHRHHSGECMCRC